ncbi:MAG: LPS-assembly protein LptD [Verrucomicrobia bacterium]|nr:MAG: LPS-assembly protein LptD [Verrucomicrobiota bacterium]
MLNLFQTLEKSWRTDGACASVRQLCRMKILQLIPVFVALALLPVVAQEIREGLPRPIGAITNDQAGVGVGGIEVNADQLEYLQEQQVIVGRGHVVITRGRERLTADFVKAHTDTQVAEARGNVTLDREGGVWRGEKLIYNFKTHQGDFGAFVAYTDPFFIRADASQRVTTNEFVLHNATFTTCDGDDPQFFMRSSEAHILNGATLEAYGVVPYLYGVPIFWLPYWQRSLDPEVVTFYLVPGYSSHMGAFALTGYGYRLADNLRSVTHVDVRSMRGVGVGEDILWKDPAPAKKYEGALRGYYANDPNPFLHADEDRTEMVKNQRYRLKLQDSRTLSERDAMLVEANYLSDPYVLEDFFDEEFRAGVQPENRFSLMHRGDIYSAGLLANTRLNNFFENIDRLPEADLDIYQTKLGDTPFYYESQNSAAFLRHVYPNSSNTNAPTYPADYDAFRVDSAHTLYYPMRHFDFLSVIPRVGYRGTFYSKTYTTSSITNISVLTNAVVTPTGTNYVLSTTNQLAQLLTEQGAGLRNLPQLGVETSFKAFKVLYDGPTGIGRDVGLRHVAEPYANYTYQPEPNLRPTDLPQFDAVDQLDLEHDVQLGLRNKLQTKRRGYVHNLVDADVYTYYRLEKTPTGTNDFSDIYTLTRLRPVDWFMVDFDAAFNPYNTEFDYFNTQIAFLTDDESRLSFEHRYTKDANNLISGELLLFPHDRWSFRTYARYDIENSQLQEHSYLLQHKNDCLGIGVGVRRLENDTMFWVQLWLSAFPQMMADLGR